jgi:hypothetical protein
MRIAVISDTHDHVPPLLPKRIARADEIWHLGDVTSEAIIVSLGSLNRPLKVVRGNCDVQGDWPLTLDFEVAGFNIRLIHIPPPRAPHGVDLLLHGHTHVPRNERVGDARFFNPGAVSRANKGAPPSFAWLTLEEGAPPVWELELLR